MRQEDAVLVRCYSCRRSREGLVRRRYTAEEIDAFAAYCLELGRCFILPIDRFPAQSNVQLRLVPARNNQKAGVNWADDFDLEALHFSEKTFSGP